MRSSVKAIALLLSGGLLFLQGCAVVRWHHQMMEGMMGGMMGHGGPQEVTSERVALYRLCQSCTYLDHQGELSLSSAQVGELKSMSQECQKEVIRKEAEVRSSEVELGDLMERWSREQVDRSALEAKEKEIGSLYVQLLLVPRKTAERAKGLLTQAQREKLKALPSSSPSQGDHRGHSMEK